MGVLEVAATPGLATVSGVEIFSTGKHQRVTWTHAKLDKAVANFHEYQLPGRVDKVPPVVLGHTEGQELMHDSGFPRVGSPTAMRRQDVPCRLCNATGKAPAGVEAFNEAGDCPVCLGTKIQGLVIADIGEMPLTIAQLIKGRAYTSVSAEIREEPPPQVPGEGANFRRITLAGGKLPWIKTLADLPMPDYEALAEETITPDIILEPRWCHAIEGGAWECFTEVAPVEHHTEGGGMDWAKKLLAYGHKKETVEKMDESAGREMAEMHDKLAAPKWEHGDKSDEDWQKHEPRTEAMESYAEMCKAKQHHNAERGKRLFGENFSEGWTVATEVFSEAKLNETVNRLVAAAVEKITGQLEPVRRDVETFKEATRKEAIEAFCEQMWKEGRIGADERDKTAHAANPRFRTVEERLLACDARNLVEKFTEKDGKEVGLTQLDIEMEAIRNRQPRRYGEHVGSGAGGTITDIDREVAKVEQFCEANADRLKKIGTPKSEIVDGFKTRRKYDPAITAEQFLNQSR